GRAAALGERTGPSPGLAVRAGPVETLARRSGEARARGRSASMTGLPASSALLILPRLRIQNANAISSPLTHGFPSMTAFLGFMWALGRRLAAAGIPLKLEKVGVICHWYQEQAQEGYVRTFHLTRNPRSEEHTS